MQTLVINKYGQLVYAIRGRTLQEQDLPQLLEPSRFANIQTELVFHEAANRPTFFIGNRAIGGDNH